MEWDFGFDPAAIIFDCDGTLVDSMPAHYRAWIRALGRYGLTFDEDRFYKLGGWPTLEVARLVERESGLPVPPEQLTLEKENLFLEQLNDIRPIEETVAVARRYHGRIPLGVGTGAIRSICLQMLAIVDIAELFDTVVAADDVTRHKPAPETYLLAAQKLGVDPEKCVVFEDTDPGIEAAVAAGMATVDVRDYYRPQRVSAAGK